MSEQRLLREYLNQFPLRGPADTGARPETWIDGATARPVPYIVLGGLQPSAHRIETRTFVS